MKRVWRKDNKEGVSPVIATILMVAITVVLAAVLYAMVMKPQGTEDLVFGNLYYKSSASSPSNGVAVFDIALSAPNNPRVEDLTVKVLNENQDTIEGVQVNWTHLVSDIEHVQGGDRLKVTVTGVDISGYEVTISVRDYSGTIIGVIPS
jgi:flagellin-like protein